MALWNLKDKKILIIDDFAEMRSMMRTMVVAYGAEKIVQAKDGDEAIEALGSHSFDIVLCDYNLGEGKDGQQVLEEAKHRNLLSAQTVFIMVTAENTSEMVMGALEFQPDAYLSKPVTKDVMQVRLKRLLDKKDSMKAIHTAMDKNNYASVLQLCDQYLQADGKYRLEILKIKSEALVKSAAYDEAQRLYEQILEERELPWAQFGIGKVHYYRKEYDEAAETFREVISNNEAFVSAYDWLAKAQEQLGDTAAAQVTLAEAIERSPKSLLRQRALADAAEKNEDYVTTEKARKKAVRVGKGSVLKMASDYTGLAKVLVKNNTAKDALRVIDSIKYEFKDNPQADLEATITSSAVHAAMGNKQKSEEALEKSLKLAASHPEMVSADLGMELAETCLKNGRKEEANELIRTVVKNHHDDKEVLDKITHVYQEAGVESEGEELIKQTQKDIVRINNQGVELIKQGKLDESIDFFTKAAKGMPQNPIINLNAAQSLIMQMKETRATKPLIARALSYIQAAQHSSSHQEWYSQLMGECRELSASITK